jgi:hypothetical protein
MDNTEDKYEEAKSSGINYNVLQPPTKMVSR